MNDKIDYPPIPPSISRALFDAVYYFAIDGYNLTRQVSSELTDILKKRSVHVSSKQVPSCTLLRKPGSPSVWRNRDDLISAGFDIEMSTGSSWELFQRDLTKTRWGEFISASQISALSSAMSSIKIENDLIEERAMRLDSTFEFSMKAVNEDSAGEDEMSSEDEDSIFSNENSGYEQGREKFISSRLVYEDAFKINAALVYAEVASREAPTAYAWEADVVRLTDNIPSRLLGPKWTGRRATGIPFHAIRSYGVQKYVIFEKTHWGFLLKKFSFDKGCIEHSWAKKLSARIKYFLTGKHDPLWNTATIKRIYGSRDYKPHDTRKRAVRLSQLLLTVDGIFQQRYLAFPNEVWNWEKFDRFVLGCISYLLGDEFIDGEIQDESLASAPTAYAQLKATRQMFKEAANNGGLRNIMNGYVERSHNPFFEIFRKSYESYLDIKDPHIQLRVRGILNQTRGAGSPPPIVAIQTKLKFIRTVSEVPAPLEKVEEELIRGTIRNLMSEIPNEAFTGLQTKAGISATSSSCYEKTRLEGGTTQAVQDMVYEGTIGRPCRILDLDTGRVDCEKALADCTPGEYIFWRSLEEALATPIEELKAVSIVVVSEPGKARSVTKGHAALKVVLDVINALCSWPLQKGVESSSSGMGKEAHGWNFFKALFYGDLAETIFVEDEITTNVIDPVTKIVTRKYRDVFCLSTDYETATDYLHHRVAEIIGDEWMRKVGIPPVLRGLVRGTCYRPRRVEFASSGFFSKYGIAVDETTRAITLSRGVLMGDPLTKVVLHLVNIGVRSLAYGVNFKDWLHKFSTNARTITELVRPDDGEFPPPRKVSN